jgi:methylmalonyl-CoA epimerase
MNFEKLDHVTIMVKDLDKARKIYSDLFGTVFSDPKENKDADIKTSISPLGIALAAPLSSDGVIAKNLEQRGEGVGAVVIKVKNVAEASDQMKAKGIRQIGRGEKVARFHPKDLNGVVFELIQD